MLVLTRKLGEKIRINDTITLSVVELNGHHVKLGIEAPRDVAVHREEVYLRIQEENKSAVGAQNQDMQKMAQLWKQKKNPS